MHEIEDVQFNEDGYPMEPLMNFHPNSEDRLCVTLWGWDTQESFDGYTTEDIDALIESLQEAKEFILNNDDNQGEFNFKGDDDDS